MSTGVFLQKIHLLISCHTRILLKAIIELGYAMIDYGLLGMQRGQKSVQSVDGLLHRGVMVI